MARTAATTSVGAASENLRHVLGVFHSLLDGPLLLLQAAHLNVDKLFFLGVSLRFKSSHVVETHEAMSFTQGDHLHLVELFCLRHVHESFCSFGNSKNVAGNDMGILVHADNRFDLVCWGKASVTHAEDVLQEDWVLRLVTVNKWMRVGNLAFAVHKDLSSSFVEASSKFVLHEISWSGEFETHAVDYASVFRVHWTAFLVPGVRESCDPQFVENWHDLIMATLELWKQFRTRTAD